MFSFVGGVLLSLYATRSDYNPPKRTHAVVTVIRIVVVQVTVRVDIANVVREHTLNSYCFLSLFLQAADIRFTSTTSPHQYSTDFEEIFIDFIL